jgi:hypothetical protein
MTRIGTLASTIFGLALILVALPALAADYPAPTGG